MHVHEAGELHAAVEAHRPGWLRVPDDVNALVPSLWPRTVRRGADGALTLGGVDVRDLAREHGTPAYLLDEEDLRGRARTFRDAFVGHGFATVYYAAKAFVTVAVARWVAEDGLGLDVCTGGELAVAARAGMPMDRVVLHGNNKSRTELADAVGKGVGRVVVDSSDEIELLAAAAAAHGRRQQVLVRVTVGVEAHTHEFIATAHEDQKFGFSLADGDAAEAVRRVLATPSLELVGLHSHIGSQIFDTAGFEVAARRLVGLHADVRAEHGSELPEMGLGGGFGIAYTTRDDPAPPEALAASLRDIVERECRARSVAVPRLTVEPGRAIAGPAVVTLYTVGTVKHVPLGGRAARRYVAVDGGMSDNIRAALYGATYSATLASRRSDAAPVLSRVVGKHCESGDVVVRDEFLPGDVRAGDLLAVPATGAYGRSMASNYNAVPRPPVVSVRDGSTQVLLRRETFDDLLALDCG